MSKVTLYDYLQKSIGTGTGGRFKFSLVQDPYSGKYYGDDTLETVQSNIRQTANYFQALLTAKEKGDFFYERNYVPETPIGGTKVDPSIYARETLDSLSKLSITPDNYVQKDQMLASYDKYRDNWMQHFEGNYKVPREKEANEYLTIPNKTAPSLAIADPARKAIKTTGTGVASTGSVNPFGTLDAGLNI